MCITIWTDQCAEFNAISANLLRHIAKDGEACDDIQLLIRSHGWEAD
jgi:hypothetical protein